MRSGLSPKAPAPVDHEPSSCSTLAQRCQLMASEYPRKDTRGKSDVARRGRSLSQAATHSQRSAGRRGVLLIFESALGAQRSGNIGGVCETRRDTAPPDTRPMPKAPHGALAAISKLHRGVGVIEITQVLYCALAPLRYRGLGRPTKPTSTSRCSFEIAAKVP